MKKFLLLCLILAGTACDQKQDYQNECANPSGILETKCGEKCTSLKTDPDNCGACGFACEQNQACQNGQCTTECINAQSLVCNRQCVSRYDTDHCGSCEVSCSNRNATDVCVAKSTGPVCETCANSESYCTGSKDTGTPDYLPTCADLQNNAEHCGSCGHPCDLQLEFCSNGKCVRQQ